MAKTYEEYVAESKGNLNKGYDATVEQLIASLGGLTNPNNFSYTPEAFREVTDPQLRSITEFLQQMGAEGYQYQYSDILNTLNNATNAAYDARYNALDDANAQFNRNMATQQESVADTIRGQYAQAIQSGVSKGMQSANMLSSILGTSQAAAQSAQQLAEDRYQTGMDKQAQIIQDAASALDTSNKAYENLMGYIRQLYNDEIQEKTADLEYNASIAETNANAAASKYATDTNYSQNVLSNASGIYGTNQSALASIMAAAAAAYGADQNYAAQVDAAAKANEAQKAYYDYLKLEQENAKVPESNTNNNSSGLTGTLGGVLGTINNGVTSFLDQTTLQPKPTGPISNETYQDWVNNNRQALGLPGTYVAAASGATSNSTTLPSSGTGINVLEQLLQQTTNKITGVPNTTGNIGQNKQTVTGNNKVTIPTVPNNALRK